VTEDLVTTTVDLPGVSLRILQPEESAGLPDAGGVEWAPIAPYWSVLWRSGVALAQELTWLELRGMRVVELGCGLGVPSIVAARGGARVLATDADPEGIELVSRNAEQNGASLETAVVRFEDADELVARAPFDLVLGADLLYEEDSVEPLLALLPKLAPQALITTPSREPARAFLEHARDRWRVEAWQRGVTGVHRLQFADEPGAGSRAS
jgi:predicted nicotinamide N-methyase